MPTTVLWCQQMSDSLGRLSPTQQTPLRSTEYVKEMVYSSTDVRGIEGSYAEGSGGPCTQ